MFKDLPEGETRYCEACEWEMKERGLTKCPKHTCKETSEVPSWEEQFCKKYPELFIILKGKDVENKRLRYLLENKVFEVKDFIRQTIISERKQAYQEGFIAGADATGSQMNDLKIEEIKKIREQAISDVKDIIINWEKELGGLKHINGDWINLTYLLGKIK